MWQQQATGFQKAFSEYESRRDKQLAKLKDFDQELKLKVKEVNLDTGTGEGEDEGNDEGKKFAEFGNDPRQGRFSYPGLKGATKITTEQRQKAEAHLTAFWDYFDSNLKKP
jgi:hypothetical protein